MKIALIGGTGRIGSRILAEATDRAHDLTVLVRRPPQSEDASAGVGALDARDHLAVAEAIRDHDAVVSAVSGYGEGDQPSMVIEVADSLIKALPLAGVRRLLVVGGAGSLLAQDGVRLIDRPGFPEAWKPGSQAQVDALAVYCAQATELDWSYLSPADQIFPGTRTGRYALGGDEAVFDGDGASRISMEDYAAALVDELEQPRHQRRRFTVGYRDQA